IALVDTNCDPDEADYVVPGNDDAIRACALITRVIADSIAEGRQKVSVKDFQPAAQENGAAPAAAAVTEEPAAVAAHEEPAAAVTLLRERGMAQAAKRAGRETTEGKVGYRLADDGSKGTMVAVGCESEQVSNTDEFLAYAKEVLELVEQKGVGAERELEEERV